VQGTGKRVKGRRGEREKERRGERVNRRIGERLLLINKSMLFDMPLLANH
jgi:hypothetical protein